VSAHKPASLPLQARIKPTLNLRPAVRGVAIEQNQIARRVVDYLHNRILDNSEQCQYYRHEEVGVALGIDPRKVRLSLAHAGGDCITVKVLAKDRTAIRKLAKKRSR
jgi:hypothetical protein